MLITALLRQPWEAEFLPSEMGIALSYTPMTLSRVVKELTATGLATAFLVGRSRWLRMGPQPQLIWERAKPLLRTPVKRTIWVQAPSPEDSRLAGLSALAHHTMLAEPEWPVVAISAADG
jgi:DNA-binding transcriptional ArsR family regulator